MLKQDGIRFFNTDGEVIEKEFKTVEWDAKAAEKEGFEHFMLKEIYEQPKAVADTIHPRIKNGEVVIEELGMSDEDILKISRIQMVACGSAYHVCVCGKYVLEQMTQIPVDVDLASEFRYRNPLLSENTLIIVVSSPVRRRILWRRSERLKSAVIRCLVLSMLSAALLPVKRTVSFIHGRDRRFPWQRRRHTVPSLQLLI